MINLIAADIKRRAQCLLHILRYTVMFTLWAVRDPNGLRTRTGRVLIWGKLRRSAIVCVPGLGARLRRTHGLGGHCNHCGASCNILMPCPQLNPLTHLCRIYESRPPVCRLFPMTPADLRDVELSTNGSRCGHHFGSTEKWVVSLVAE
jgi:Putative zinc- or iron-chelating domain